MTLVTDKDCGVQGDQPIVLLSPNQRKREREREMACIPSPLMRASPRPLPHTAPSTSSAAAAAAIVCVKRDADAVKGSPNQGRQALVVGRRAALSACLTGLTLSVAGAAGISRAAILEADDDVELLEKVKEDRKKRLERQAFISSSGKERGYLQDLVYKLSRVGQAIDNNDLSAASSVLGSSTDADWVQKVNAAFNKLSSSSEEKTEVDAFNSSLSSLLTSVAKRDIESSKLAFLSSANALENWIGLTGLVGQLKGL